MILLITSCTVQKRYHRKGFNINWNHISIGNSKENKLKNQKSQEISENLFMVGTFSDYEYETDKNDFASSENKIEEFVNSKNSDFPIKSKTKKSAQTNKIQSTKNNNSKILLLKSKNKKAIKTYNNDEENKSLNGWALTSFILSIISLFASFWGAFVCVLLVIIFSSIAFKQIKANPDKYKGFKLAQTALLICTIAMALWSIIFLLL